MKSLDELIKSLHSVHPFPDEQVDAFIAKLKYKKFSKKRISAKTPSEVQLYGFYRKRKSSVLRLK